MQMQAKWQVSFGSRLMSCFGCRADGAVLAGGLTPGQHRDGLRAGRFACKPGWAPCFCRTIFRLVRRVPHGRPAAVGRAVA